MSIFKIIEGINSSKYGYVQKIKQIDLLSFSVVTLIYPLLNGLKSNLSLSASGSMSYTSTHLIDSFSYLNFYQLNQEPKSVDALLNLSFLVLIHILSKLLTL